MASISVNGQTVGTSANMFVRQTFDLKQALLRGTNNISVFFESPLTYSESEFEKQVEDFYEVPPACVVPQFQGECHANHIRKMQASFRQGLTSVIRALRQGVVINCFGVDPPV